MHAVADRSAADRHVIDRPAAPPTARSDADRVAFQRFVLDTKSRLLLADDRPVAMGARTFDLLAYLVAHRDREVCCKEILASVWKGLSVAENNVTVQIFNLRRALAEHGGQGLIITLSNQCYRFVGDVTDDPIPLAPAPRTDPQPPAPTASAPVASRRTTALYAAIVAAIAVLATLLYSTGWFAPDPFRLSIAVLPFRDLTDGANHSYMAAAITDDLTTDLAHIPGSTVIARETTDALQTPSTRIADIGAALNVNYVLLGSIRIEDGIYHINCQLIETAKNQQIWTDQFDTSAGKLTDIQTTIVRRIASELDTALTDLRGQHDRPDDPTAEDMYYRARSLLERDGSLQGFSQAQSLLEKSVALEPTFADALAELGLTLVLKVRSVDDPAADADLARARTVIAAALRLPGASPTALAAQARLNETDGDCQQANQNARAALNLEPNNIDAYAVLARCAVNMGQFDQAADSENTILRLNPGSTRNKPRYLFLAEIRLLQGRYQDAIDLTYRAGAGDGDPTPGTDALGRAEAGRLLLISASALNGDTAHAHKLYTDYDAIWPHRSVWRIAAYSPKALARLPAFARLLSGLQMAGMPVFADEHSATANAPAPRSGVFDAVPASIPGVHTLDTQALAHLLQTANPAIFDLGMGVAVPPHATLLHDDRDLETVIAAQLHGDRTAPVVLLATGTFGASSYTAALRLHRAGFTYVQWYRGGEEAWAAAGMPSTDQRLQY